MQSAIALKARYDHAVAGRSAPLAILDVPAYRENAADLVRRAGGRPIRLATKSLRVRSVIEEISAMPGYSGLLAYSLSEALFLRAAGSSDDIVVAYPTVDRTAIAALVRDERDRGAITLMVDCVEHLDLIESAVRAEGSAVTGPVKVALDVDASWRPLGTDRVHLGVRRSPVHTPEQAAALARQVVSRTSLHLDGLMAYEAQIAGIGDRPASRARGVAIRTMQARSAAELAERRAAVVAAVSRVAALRFVNGGGTGSLERTSAEEAVTEVAAGSGVFGPHLFDSYSAFRPTPAALFALPVVRKPAPGWVTLFSGGYLASGPADAQRLPQVYLPDGLALTGTEGAGEVQTPVHGAAADRLHIGALVWLRHAKAGELAERFDRFLLVHGDSAVGEAPTYRGEGCTFG